MIKAVIISDSHGNNEALRKIIDDNPDADYYFHCGDFDADISEFPELTAVCGNHDEIDEIDLPLERILTVYGHRILMMHGHKYIYTMKDFKQTAAIIGKKNNCDIVMFGHVHVPVDEVIDGVRVINPGSLLFNFNLKRIGYMIITFNEDGSYETERIILPRKYQIT